MMPMGWMEIVYLVPQICAPLLYPEKVRPLFSTYPHRAMNFLDHSSFKWELSFQASQMNPWMVESLYMHWLFHCKAKTFDRNKEYLVPTSCKRRRMSPLPVCTLCLSLAREPGCSSDSDKKRLMSVHLNGVSGWGEKWGRQTDWLSGGPKKDDIATRTHSILIEASPFFDIRHDSLLHIEIEWPGVFLWGMPCFSALYWIGCAWAC